MQELLITGIKPVDSDEDGRQLARAVAEHRANYDVYETLKKVTYYDDGISGLTWRQISPYGYEENIERSGAAMYVRAGWIDAATVGFALSRYATFSNPQWLEIGPWSHGGEHHADPFLPPDKPPDPSVAEQLRRLVSFFDANLKEDNPAPRSKVSYYTMNGGGWHTVREWPPPGFARSRLYFGPGGTLTRGALSGGSGSDRYEVDFTATTSNATRWDTQLDGGDVVYPDRAEEDRKLLTYTSPP